MHMYITPNLLFNFLAKYLSIQSMSSRNSNDDDNGKAFALRQYEDTDGHFSLVRRVYLISVSNRSMG